MRVKVPPHVGWAARRGEYEGSVNGAVLIVDAEGSTELSARLQRYGNEGAESLADVLATVFEPMVGHVVSNGGFIAEFAGDGIIGVFAGEGPDAVARAARAAMGIMGDLARVGTFSTADGAASLLLRSVVAWGEVTWAVWTSDRPDASQNATYTYLGPAVAEAQRGEAVTPGGVLTSGPSALPFLPADVVTAPLAEGFSSVEIQPTPLPATPDSPPLADLRGHRFFPATLDRLEHRGEYRDVVSVFLEFRKRPGTGPESAMRSVLEALDDRRGYLCNIVQPDANRDAIRAFLLWGAPTSHEHDIGHALRFLADVREAVGDDVRAGVTRSTAFTGFVGTSEQASYTAIGSGVNLAARMCHGASWGEIRIDGRIAEHLDESWETDDLGGLDYRGFAEPIRTHVVAYVPPVQQLVASQNELVGRHVELDHLEDLLAPLWSGRSVGIVAITGEAGIGKSRFVAELRHRLRARNPQPVWLVAQADEIRTQPLATLSDALAGAFGRPGRAESSERLAAYIANVATDAPELAAELERGRRTFGDLLGIPEDQEAAANLDPRTRFDNAVLAVTNLVRAEARVAPVILSIVDGQWIDPATAEIIDRVRSELENDRVAVLVATRDPDTGLQPDTTIELSPIDAAGIEQLGSLLLGSQPSAELVALLGERSGGNPFFLRQLLEYFQRNELLDRRDDGWHVTASDSDLPMDVQRLLVSRIDELPQDVRRVVQLGAVLGREIDVRLLQAMTSDPNELTAHISGAVEARLWQSTDDDHVAFRDHLVKDAAYGMLLGSDVRAIHGSAADGLRRIHGDDPTAAAELAYHLDGAGRGEEAAPQYVTAGTQAAQRFDNATALAHLGRALELTPEDDAERRMEPLRGIYAVHDVQGNRDAQESTIESMARFAETTGSHIEIATLRAQVLAARGAYPEADDVAAQALATASGEGASQQVGSLTFIRGQLARYLGRPEDAASFASSARSIFGAVGDAGRTAMVDDFLGGLAWERGEFDDAARLHRSAADTFHQLGQVVDEIRALNNLGSAIISIGDYSAARSIHEDGVARSREIGYRMGEGDHLDNVGGTAWAVGDHELAIERYSEALAIRSAMDDAWGVAISSSNLGLAHLAIGNTAEALRWYREALEVDQRIGRRRGEGYNYHGIGLCHLAVGRYDLAGEALDEAAAIRIELGEQHLANESSVAGAVAMKRRGDSVEAVELVRKVLDTETESPFEGAVETTATLLRCIGVLEDGDPELAASLRQRTAARVAERAARISDPDQRASYLDTDVHRRATTDRG